jgi:hypothetical protein
MGVASFRNHRCAVATVSVREKWSNVAGSASRSRLRPAGKANDRRPSRADNVRLAGISTRLRAGQRRTLLARIGLERLGSVLEHTVGVIQRKHERLLAQRKAKQE